MCNTDLPIDDCYIFNKNDNQINNIFSKNLKTILVSDDKSPLKRISYIKPKSKITLIKLKKNKKSSIATNNIQTIDYKIKNKKTNFFINNNKFEYPYIKKNNKVARTTHQFSSFNDINNRNEKDLLIGNKLLSLEKLKNKINKMDLYDIDNNEIIQLIQSTKYHTMYNNDNNISISSTKNSYETKKAYHQIFRVKPKFINYHLSYVPLNKLYNCKDSETAYNNNSLEKKNSSHSQIPFSSQYSTKDNTKCNTFRNKINSRN